ncbi:MAG: hypothetical protein KAQ79_07150, partial [Cyclobacteriaceae bacterium]|nr:hypothetical protein [Cyclobacteriaceae bacterium]
FLLITLILCLSFSIRTASCEELRDNKVLDEKVRMFLENRKGTWHDQNIPYSDGKVLYDVILKNRYTKAIERRRGRSFVVDLFCGRIFNLPGKHRGRPLMFRFIRFEKATSYLLSVNGFLFIIFPSISSSLTVPQTKPNNLERRP